MNVLWQVLYLLLWIVRWMVIGRVVIEIVRIFARTWRPAGVPAVAMEAVYSVTDPPVKLLRRVIPTIKLGGVGFDLSILILLIVLQILMSVVIQLAVASM